MKFPEFNKGKVADDILQAICIDSHSGGIAGGQAGRQEKTTTRWNLNGRDLDSGLTTIVYKWLGVTSHFNLHAIVFPLSVVLFNDA